MKLAIIVIEDNLFVAKLIGTVVGAHGHAALIFHAAVPALKYLRCGDVCDLIITDSELPDFRDDSIVEALGTVSPAPILICTGIPVHEVNIPERLRNRVCVLQKPFRQEHLMAMIGELCARCRVVQSD